MIIKKRLKTVIIILLAWLVAAVAFNLDIAMFSRDRYIAEGRRISRYCGVYYPPRGRLLDRGGTPLAWTERYFDLVWQGRNMSEIPPAVRRELREIFPAGAAFAKKAPAYGAVLRENITADKIMALEPLLTECKFLNIRQRIVRRRLPFASLASIVGATAVSADGCIKGTSGAELQYDKELSGESGTYEVMLDRHRNWIYNTWEITRQAVPGRDIIIPFDCEAGK